jgi:SAM-dependent methyltransferase
MDETAQRRTQKPATAARMYDYYLGGIHNFRADQEAAKMIMMQFPCMPAVARANRAFLGRAVRHLVDLGVRQFLDIGSGIPTVGNVHEIAQKAAPDTRVVYVDIDPVAVAESLEILDGNPLATAIREDLRRPQEILDHAEVRRLLDLDQPVGLLVVSMLHFVPDYDEACAVVARLVDALAPGSHLVLSHAAAETFEPIFQKSASKDDVYKEKTATPGTSRFRGEVERFFAGLELLEPGVVGLNEWRPDPDATAEPAELEGIGSWTGVARKA